jgi:hypothetical protein
MTGFQFLAWTDTFSSSFIKKKIVYPLLINLLKSVTHILDDYSGTLKIVCAFEKTRKNIQVGKIKRQDEEK